MQEELTKHCNEHWTSEPSRRDITIKRYEDRGFLCEEFLGFINIREYLKNPPHNLFKYELIQIRIELITGLTLYSKCNLDSIEDVYIYPVELPFIKNKCLACCRFYIYGFDINNIDHYNKCSYKTSLLFSEVNLSDLFGVIGRFDSMVTNNWLSFYGHGKVEDTIKRTTEVVPFVDKIFEDCGLSV